MFMLQSAKKSTGAVDGTAAVGLLSLWFQWVYLEMKLNTLMEMFYWAYTYSVAVGVPVLLPRKEKARNEVAVPLLLTSPLGGYELSSRNMGLSPGVCGLVGIS
jgi:hypothetical protein